MKWCEVCDTKPVHAKGRCHACYRYLRRNGKDRDKELIQRASDRRYAQQPRTLTAKVLRYLTNHTRDI